MAAILAIFFILAVSFLCSAAGVWFILALLHWVGIATAVVFTWKLALAVWLIVLVARFFVLPDGSSK